MAVRVRVRLRARGSGSSVETTALANSGFETPGPEVVIPLALAEELGLDLSSAVIELYEMASGMARALRLPEAVEISVITGDRVEGPVVADAVIMESSEVLLSDQTLSALKLDLVDPARGLWRFRDEPSSVLRESPQPEVWPRRSPRP